MHGQFFMGGSGTNGLIKKPQNCLVPIFFSPDFTLNGQVSLFCAEKWIFHKKLGTLLHPFASGNFAEKHILKLPSAIKLLETLRPKGPF